MFVYPLSHSVSLHHLNKELERNLCNFLVNKRESNEGEVREGSTIGKGGLYKMPQIPTLPQKWPRSGVTFHYLQKPKQISVSRWR